MTEYRAEFVAMVLSADAAEGFRTTVEEFHEWLNTIADRDSNANTWPDRASPMKAADRG